MCEIWLKVDSVGFAVLTIGRFTVIFLFFWKDGGNNAQVKSRREGLPDCHQARNTCRLLWRVA
jgi:hypothetical protein